MQFRKGAARKLVFFAVLFVIISCAPKGNLLSPKVELSGLNIKGVSLSHITYTATLGVYNPNNFDIHVDSVEYALYLNGSKFMDGADSVDVTIRPRQEAQVDVHLSGSLFSALRALSSLSRSQKINFEMKGTIHGSASGLGPSFSKPFEENGTLDFQQLNPGIPLQ